MPTTSVYTLNFVSKPENKASTENNVDWIDHAEKLAKYKVRILMRAPFPAAIEYLTGPSPSTRASTMRRSARTG
jgi:peptide/nickel transport system substrate-binding protein